MNFSLSKRPLSKRPISEIMTDHVMTISQEDTIQTAAAIMVDYQVPCLIVLNKKKPVGIITERDFVLLGVNGKVFKQPTKLKNIIRGKLVSISKNTKYSKAFALLNTYGFKQLPVIEKGVLVGLVTMKQMLIYSKNLLIKSLDDNKSLTRTANTDALTKTYNSRHFDKRIKEMFGLVDKFAIRASVIFIDIDHFKRINDEYSHAAGDYVLKTIAKLFLKLARKSDSVYRYGGEEFVIITPYTTSPEAAHFAHKIRRLVEAYPFLYRGKPLPVTISAGVASISSANSPGQVFDRADKAM